MANNEGSSSRSRSKRPLPPSDFSLSNEQHDILIHHLIKNHPEKFGDQSEDATSSEGSTGTDPNTFRFSYNEYKKAVAELICTMSLRFSFASNDHFDRVIKCFNPEARKIPTSEIIKEIIKLVKESKSKLINDFTNISSKVSICSDIWSDGQNEFHFIEITCHWIDDTWVLHKRLLAHNYVNFKKPAISISRKMHKILQIYGLHTKVFSISFDHETANTVGVESLINKCQSSIGANFFYTRCISNVLTICVRDILDTFHNEIKPIRNAILYLFNDSSSTKKWANICKLNGLPPKYFWVDMPTRWISSYKMFNGMNQYREVLCKHFTQQQYENGISMEQWDLCYDLCQLLKIFKDVTKELSGVYYPTSVLVVDNFVKIAVAFKSLIGCDRVGECIAKIMVKWLDYFYEIPNIFLIAKILDPRIRVDGLEKMLGFYYDALFPVKNEKTPIPSVIIANAKQYLFDIFNEYRIKYSEKLGINTSTSSCDDDSSLAFRLQNFFNERSGKFPKRYDSCNINQEMEAYLAADFEFAVTESFDILKWWSRWRLNFPIVSLIAMDVLAVPASIASFEQAFRRDGYIIKDPEINLTPHMREKKRLLGDWVTAEERQQEMDTDEDDDDLIDSDTDSFNDF